MSSIHTYSVSRTLPASTSSSKIVSLLHTHSNIITLSPFVVAFQNSSQLQQSASELSEIYSITDRIELLPCGLLSRDVIVTAAFTNQDNGTIIERYAPLGFKIEECWSIKEELRTNSEQSTNWLVLEVKLTANKWVLPFFKSMMVKNHHGYIDGMLKVILEDAKTEAI